MENGGKEKRKEESGKTKDKDKRRRIAPNPNRNSERKIQGTLSLFFFIMLLFLFLLRFLHDAECGWCRVFYVVWYSHVLRVTCVTSWLRFCSFLFFPFVFEVDLNI